MPIKSLCIVKLHFKLSNAITNSKCYPLMTLINQLLKSVLVSYCHVTNYYEFYDSEQHLFISQFLWVRSLCTDKLDLTRHGGTLPNSCYCWQNSCPCRGTTHGSSSLKTRRRIPLTSGKA